MLSIFIVKKKTKNKTICEWVSKLRREILSEEFLFNMYYSHVKIGENESIFKSGNNLGKVIDCSNVIYSKG